jgi:hypothetical protein
VNISSNAGITQYVARSIPDSSNRCLHNSEMGSGLGRHVSDEFEVALRNSRGIGIRYHAAAFIENINFVDSNSQNSSLYFVKP